MVTCIDEIGYYEDKDVKISTKLLSDNDFYETCIMHTSYYKNAAIVVEEYLDKKNAQIGHDKWVKKMTARVLPDTLEDVGTCDIRRFLDAFDKQRIIYHKEQS